MADASSSSSSFFTNNMSDLEDVLLDGSAPDRDRDRDPDRPTYADIFAMLEERRSRYSTLHKEMEEDQDWIYAAATRNSGLLDKFIKGFPKGFTLKILPLAELGVSVATDNIMVGETPSVTVALPHGLHKDSAAEQQQADELKNFCEGFLYQVDTATAETPLRDFIKKGFGLGVSILSYAIMFDKIPPKPTHGRRTRKEKEAWANYEHERKYSFPFDVKSIHPLTIFPDPDNDPPLDFIEEVEVNLREMCRKYPHLLERKPDFIQRLRPAGTGAGVGNPVKRVTYISKKYYAVYVDGVPLLTEKDGADAEGVAENPCGYLWMRQAHAGFGELDHRGRLEYRVKGLIRNARDVMASIITDYNVTEVMRQITAFPPVEFIADEKEEAENASEDFVYGPAQVFAHSSRVAVRPFKPPDVPAVVFQNHEMANQLLTLLFGPDVLRGVFREDTAAGQRTRLRQAQMPYQAMKTAAEQCVAGMLTDILCAIRDELDGPVTVWTKIKGRDKSFTLDPKRIPSMFKIMVDFTPPTQEERDFKLKEGLELYEHGVITKRRLMAEYAGIADPEAEMIDIAAEKLIDLGPVQEWEAGVMIEKAQQRLLSEDPDMAAAGGAPAPLPGAPGPQPGMTGGAMLPAPAGQLNVGPGGFTPSGAQPAPPTVDSPEALTMDGGASPFQQTGLPAPQLIRGA